MTNSSFETTGNESSQDALSRHNFVNISAYRFVRLDLLPLLQADIYEQLKSIGVLGTILLAEEGINIALAGTQEQIDRVRAYLNGDPRFAELDFKLSRSARAPFSKLKVRIRHEIIAFDGEGAGDKQLHRKSAPTIAADELVSWIESGKRFTLLDTRNDYEIESGTFDQAVDLKIGHFRDFKAGVKKALQDQRLDPSVPVVTFCTGGVRCEKAAPWMLEAGFSEVYQIEGGILRYLETTGGRYWRDNCFVFDDRVEVNRQLEPTGAHWCDHCQRTVAPGNTCVCQSLSTAEETV